MIPMWLISIGNNIKPSLLTKRWTGVTNQPAEMINSTYKSIDVIYDWADTLKSDSD